MARPRRVLSIGSPGTIVNQFLERRGYATRVTCFDTAHREVAEWRPDIVLVDPLEVDDDQAFADSVRWSTAVLVVAHSDRPHAMERFLTYDVCLVRPIDPFELHSILSAWPARTKSTNAPLT